VSEPELFDFDPKRGAQVSVALLACAAALWAITGKVSGAVSLAGVGAFLGMVTIFLSRRKR
jgi:hypothetical protein